MLMDASYAIWGGALAALLTLLLVVSIMRGVRYLKRVFKIHPADEPAAFIQADGPKDIEHRALMFLMNQKTDSMLAALANAIAQERQKLGVIVRNPSMPDGFDVDDEPRVENPDASQSTSARVLSMARKGTSMKTIARQLDLSEAEVSLVMRLNPA